MVPDRRLLIAIGLLSAAVLAFQIILLQVFSFVQWYHFAYMIISVALLGFGASGTVLSVARTWFLARSRAVLPIAMGVCGVSMPVVLALSQLPFARFESYLLLSEWSHTAALFVTYLLLAIPFFSGALAIGLSFVENTARVGRLYFANLVGSALGGLSGYWLLNLTSPEPLPAVTGLIALCASLLVTSRWTVISIMVSVISLAVTVLFAAYPPSLRPSEYKDLSRARLLPEVEAVAVRPSPYGLIHVLRGAPLRHAPGLSLAFRGNVPSSDAVFVDGNAIGSIPPEADSAGVLDFTTAVLPYVLTAPGVVLILNSGAGEAVSHALGRHANAVKAVEPHPGIISLLSGDLAQASDSLLHRPEVEAFSVEPRNFLAADTSRYSMIIFPTIGSFGGAAGLQSMQEQYGLTTEAFDAMWRRLEEDGVMAVTAWMDYPYRNPLRVLATLVETLKNSGISRPADHLAAVRSWGTITFVLLRRPLSPEQAERVRQLCERLLFDPVLLPGITPAERVTYNNVQDTLFFDYVDMILSKDRDAFYQTYPFRIRPATDNQPYFSQFVRWNHLGDLRNQYSDRSIPFFELGTLIVALTLIQIALVATVLIVLPLLGTGWISRGRWRTVFYFGGLGIGYMFFEMIMIQRYVLYFGHSVFAVSAVFTILLFGSGIGSLLSEKIISRWLTLVSIAGGTALAILATALILPFILDSTMSLATGPKVLIAAVTLGPVAILMGMPFPLGLRLLSDRRPTHVPWAWGINGCLSVTSTAAATLLLVEIGAVAVLLSASAAYALVTLAAAADRPRF